MKERVGDEKLIIISVAAKGIKDHHCFRIFYSKLYLCFTFKNSQPRAPGNKHCANCLGTLSFPMATHSVEKVTVLLTAATLFSYHF